VQGWRVCAHIGAMRSFCLFGALLAVTEGAKDPCECLKWKDLYAPVPQVTEPIPTTWPRLVCGEALETMTLGAPDMPSAFFAPLFMGFSYHEFCASFYHRMDNNYCVNTGMVEYGTTGHAGAQWCVVSSECRELNGGRPVASKKSFYYGPQVLSFMRSFDWWRNFFNTITPKADIPRDVSWKLCTKGKDKMLRDLEPMEVMELAKRQDSVIGYVTKMAYQRLIPSGPEGKPGGSDWAHVEDMVKKGQVEKMPKVLKDAIEDNVPIVIDVDPNGHTHQWIVHGKKVFQLENKCDHTGCGGRQWPFRRSRDMGEL